MARVVLLQVLLLEQSSDLHSCHSFSDKFVN